jgi:hypothetical protein
LIGAAVVSLSNESPLHGIRRQNAGNDSSFVSEELLGGETQYCGNCRLSVEGK